MIRRLLHLLLVLLIKKRQRRHSKSTRICLMQKLLLPRLRFVMLLATILVQEQLCGMLTKMRSYFLSIIQSQVTCQHRSCPKTWFGFPQIYQGGYRWSTIKDFEYRSDQVISAKDHWLMLDFWISRWPISISSKRRQPNWIRSIGTGIIDEIRTSVQSTYCCRIRPPCCRML